MSLNIVSQLYKAQPKKRIKLIFEMQKKNIAFLKKRNLELGNFVEQTGTGAYEIQVNDEFLNIIDRRLEQQCHPQDKLYQYITELGAWHHTGWIDKMEVLHTFYPGIEHGQRLIQFVEKMHEKLPRLTERMGTGMVSLPKLSDGQRFSGVTVFLGIFTGLHIAHYLSQTLVDDMVLLEPDIERFSLSCFFLDYEALEKRFGRLVMHVGPDMPDNPPALLMGPASITAAAWLRFLPAYPSPAFDELIAKFSLHWRKLIEIFVPFDREVRNLTYGLRNLQAGVPINDKPPQLSAQSRIALIASGPSLDNDLAWLKQNQDKLIIFAAHSSMRSLQKHGIRADYQFCLDTELEDSLIEKLQLDFEIPFLPYYKARPESLKKFKKVLLINELYKANPVKFERPILHTHPTTGNLAMATATFARPAQLYLIGLDLGFRHLQQDHVADYWANQDKPVQETPAPEPENGRTQPVPFAANFPESEGKIYTHAYYSSAHGGIEEAIITLQGATIVYNLSDGVLIKGAQAQHSAELELSDYPEKEADKQAFENAFSSAREGVWQPYKTSGKQLFETMQSSLRDHCSTKRFDWHTFSRTLNSAWSHTTQRCVALEPGDLRVEAYSKLFTDLLTEWFRVLIFTKTPKEVQTAYELGLESFISVLESLEWPAELDLEMGEKADAKEPVDEATPVQDETDA